MILPPGVNIFSLPHHPPIWTYLLLLIFHKCIKGMFSSWHRSINHNRCNHLYRRSFWMIVGSSSPSLQETIEALIYLFITSDWADSTFDILSGHTLKKKEKKSMNLTLWTTSHCETCDQSYFHFPSKSLSILQNNFIITWNQNQNDLSNNFPSE